MILKFIIALVGFFLVVAGLGAVKVAQIQKMSSQSYAQPATAVTTVEARSETWSPVLEAIATLAPVEGVLLGADADGTITRIAVENGAAVKAGDVLVEFDRSVEEAQVAAAEARLSIAGIDLQRATELKEKKTISQAELDQATAQLKQATADTAALRALLAKKTVRAPFDGRVGLRLVNLGQYVSRGAPLLPLQKLNPMYANFSLPQQQLPSLAVGQNVRVTVDAFPGRDFPARIAALDSEVDVNSRNITVQALLENPGELLRAGMFARVAVELPAAAPSIVLPATAIAYASYGNSVYVIENMKDPKGNSYLGARQQFVKLGTTRGDQVAVLEGLKPGEQVASAGVFKLRNGLNVQINNTVQPSNSPAPKPTNT